MKHNTLAKTIAAALAITAGVAQDAHAVHLNPNGTGQVLVYPYFTVNSGNQTLFTVVNKTDAGKAIKVRFREGRNSRSVLDFNLYLSPFDVWTATVFSRSDTGPNNPANLVTSDNSCTVPRINDNPSLPVLPNGSRYVPFMNLSYTGLSDEAGPNTLDRTREGYFELIEMGEVTNWDWSTLSAITHGSTSEPGNCLQVEHAWLPIGTNGSPTYWSVNSLVDMNVPGGGLFGTAAIIDVLSGTMLSYNAEALGAFSNFPQHSTPGSSEPTLASVRDGGSPSTVVANVFQEGSIVSSIYATSRGIDAVSALFAQEELFNQFATGAASGATSEWIVTFPTKYAYVDEAIVGAGAIPPFTRIFPTTASASNPGTAAVDVAITIFSREEQSAPIECPDPTDPICSPFFPPPPGPPTPKLFWASNVMGFNQPNAVASGSSILGSRLATNVQAADWGIEDGWATLRLFDATPSSGSLMDRHRTRADVNGGTWLGLPAVGFSATAYTNGQVTPGVLSNHADMSRHRGSNAYEAGAFTGLMFQDEFE